MIKEFIILLILSSIALYASHFYGSYKNIKNFKLTKYYVSIMFLSIVFEELLFRDYFIIKFYNYENKELLSGLLFGLVHISNIFAKPQIRTDLDKIIYVTTAIPVISYMGYFCALQHNILYAIMIHTIYNIISLNALYYSNNFKQNKYIEHISSKPQQKIEPKCENIQYLLQLI